MAAARLFPSSTALRSSLMPSISCSAQIHPIWKTRPQQVSTILPSLCQVPERALGRFVEVIGELHLRRPVLPAVLFIERQRTQLLDGLEAGESLIASGVEDELGCVLAIALWRDLLCGVGHVGHRSRGVRHSSPSSDSHDRVANGPAGWLSLYGLANQGSPRRKSLRWASATEKTAVCISGDCTFV